MRKRDGAKVALIEMIKPICVYNEKNYIHYVIEIEQLNSVQTLELFYMFVYR